MNTITTKDLRTRQRPWRVLSSPGGDLFLLHSDGSGRTKNKNKSFIFGERSSQRAHVEGQLEHIEDSRSCITGISFHRRPPNIIRAEVFHLPSLRRLLRYTVFILFASELFKLLHQSNHLHVQLRRVSEGSEVSSVSTKSPHQFKHAPAQITAKQ
jgi:hypothetical protein